MRSRKTDPRLWEPTFLLNYDMIRAIRAQVEKRFPLGNQGRILDVGCGAMPYRQLFDRRCGEYLGCDYYPQDPSVVQCPAEKLSFPDAQFDAVVCFQVLEHVSRPWEVVSECARVLKPDGILILTAPFIFPHHPSPTDYFRFTHEGLRVLAESQGLETIEILGQVHAISTLCLLGNWYEGLLWQKFNKKSQTRPLAWLIQGLGIIPTNLLGLAARHLPMGYQFQKGNLGLGNYMIISRKSGMKPT